MPKVAYDKNVENQLLLGSGEEFYGSGALVILKSLLQSGISYFASYPGSPTSTVTTLVGSLKDNLLRKVGVHVEESSNEAAAAAALRASISNRVRGAAAFKIVGFNVASDAVTHIASSGVTGGAVILVGEDYGCNNTIVAEKSLPYAYKSGLPVLDSSSNLQHLSDLIEGAFDLSEYCGSPVIVIVRGRVGYMSGVVKARDNKFPEVPSIRDEALEKIPFPPYSQVQEAEKYEFRLPRAAEFVKEEGINKTYNPDSDGRRGIITHSILTNVVLSSLASLGIKCPVYALYCLYPIVESEIVEFLKSKEEVLVVEEGMPNLIEKEVRAVAQQNTLKTKLFGKDVIPKAGELSPNVVLQGISSFFNIPQEGKEPQVNIDIPERDPTFCTGCPERPIFSAIKIMKRKYPKAKLLFGSDIGCYALGGLPPFNLRGSVTGMGTGMASSGALSKIAKERAISFMGDGTFWHSGLTTSVANALHNKQDGILIVFYNYHTAMTGHQRNLSTPEYEEFKKLEEV